MGWLRAEWPLSWPSPPDCEECGRARILSETMKLHCVPGSISAF